MVQHNPPSVSASEPNHVNPLTPLGQVLRLVREADDADRILGAVIHYLHRTFNVQLVWLGLYDRLEHRLIGKGGVTSNGDLPILKQRFSLNPGDILEQVIIQQKQVSVVDLRSDQRAGEWRKVAETLGIQGAIVYPIRYKRRSYGVALLGSTLWGTVVQGQDQARLSIVLGSLATALFHMEQEWQRQQAKRSDQPLLSVLNQLSTQGKLGVRLQAIVDETHQFIQPTRTSIFWFEGNQRYFWRRVSHQQRSAGLLDLAQPAAGITVQEASGFYQALCADQLVSIGEAETSLTAETSTRLMQQIRARSLLAAPILVQGELLGFLSAEGNEARIWEEEEKQYLRGAAQLIALIAPLHQIEETVEQIKLDQTLTAGIARSVYSDEDWKGTLRMAAEQVCKRLRVERFAVLLYEPEHDRFDVGYQCQPTNRRALTSSLERLSDTDWKLVETSAKTVCIENLTDDLKLLAWRDRFLEVGTRSLMACSTALSNALEAVLVVGHESPRTWSRSEQEILQAVAQQIGIILRQWQLQKQNHQQRKTYQAIQQGLVVMQEADCVEYLELTAIQHIAQVMQVPLALLIHWQPGASQGRIIAPVMVSDRFAVDREAGVQIERDRVIRSALESVEVVTLTANDLPTQTRAWLHGPGIGQVLTIALRTAPNHPISGIVVIADTSDRRWTYRHLNAFATLVSQLAWARRYLQLTEKLQAENTGIAQLNWYKHRTLEETMRVVNLNLKRLADVDKLRDPLYRTRVQQLTRQMKDALESVPYVIEQEQWELQPRSGSLQVVSLLKRSLERVEGIIKQRQLWSQVHDETNLIVGGDIEKTEMVLYEVLLAACERSRPGSRIDLWCRQIDSRWFELSITDQSELDPALLLALSGKLPDSLAPSPLDSPSGRHLRICQLLIEQLGGQFHVFRLDDGRTHCQLILPIAN